MTESGSTGTKRDFLSSRQRLLRVGSRDHESHGIDRRYFEAIPLVEPLGILRNRVNQNGADTADFSSLQSPQDSVAQKTPTDILTLPALLYPQPPHDHH